MKNLNNTEMIRDINGGGYFECRVCHFTNKSFWVVYRHALAHTIGFLSNL